MAVDKIWELPEEWKAVRMGDERIIDKMRAGGTPLRTRKEYWENGKIPFVKIEDITRTRKYLNNTENRITEIGLNNSSAWLVPSNTLLLSMYASFGEVAINKIPVATNQAIIAIMPKKTGLDLEYLYYTLSKFKKSWWRYLRETTQKNLNAEIVKNFTIPLPPLPEQRKIAESLETVDNAIEKTDRIIEKQKRIKQGLMQDLLTKGIDENGRIRSEETHKFKDSLLGRIPEEWEILELGEVADLNPEKIRYEKRKIINYIDIESIKDGVVVNFKVFKIEEAPSRAQRMVRTNDVIVSTVRPNLKAFSIIKPAHDQFICSTGFAVLRTRAKVIPLFLFYLVWHDEIFLKQVLPLVVGSNYPAVNSRELENIQIPLSSLPEQHRIAFILSQIDETIEKEHKYKEKLGRIKQGLMEDLLTGKVRVNHMIFKEVKV